jgi:nucleotide-binding universal stress UspA family protein
MYTSILIPTDGRELVGKAVQRGIALARRRIGAKATML